MADTMELGSVEEAKAFAQNKGRPFLVLSRETLDQIEATEAAGGFEGGMSDEDRLPPPASAGRVCAAGGRTRCPRRYPFGPSVAVFASPPTAAIHLA
jgi:hypothetical protein